MINVGIIYSLENLGEITETLHMTRSGLEKVPVFDPSNTFQS